MGKLAWQLRRSSLSADSAPRSTRPLVFAIGLLAAALTLLLASMIGAFSDRESGELHLFIKHRPSTILYFSSPLGEGDLPAGSLPPREAQREIELVEAGGGLRRSVWIPR